MKHKLTRLLENQDKEQLSRFQAYIASPYFNTNKRIIALATFITECYLQDSEMPSKQRLFDATFPGEPFQDNKIRAMLSMLTKHVEDFLVIEHVQQSRTVKQQLMLVAGKNIDDTSLFQEYLDKGYETQAQNPFRDIDYYFAHQQLEEANYNFAVKNKEKEIGQSLANTLYNLDYYYISKRLKYYCESLNRRNILGEDQAQGGLTLLQDLLDNYKESLPHIARIYQQIIITYEQTEEVGHFYQLLYLLKQSGNLFTRAELKVMYGYAMNYCIRKINSGQPLFLQEVFKLYKVLLEENIILEGKYISQWDYKNIVTTALRLNEITWTEEFVHQYKELLHPDARENAYAYNYANLSYYKKDYNTAMKLLQQVSFTNDSYLLSSRSLLMKSYYELGEHELLKAQGDAFMLYLRRNKVLPEYQKRIYINMVRQIVKLSQFKLMGVPVTEKVRKTLTTQQDIADITWLRNKMAELD